MLTNIIFLGIMGGPELIIIGVLLIVLFGGKKIPEIMRGLGKGIKDIKKVTEENELTKDIKDISSEINEVSSGIRKMTSPTEFLKSKKK
ncbi:MAG: twin-arginine translocase TatA/TatE family subunit [Bacteroidetes bacterium]|nr:twin-arginine translocase TatA/TatE family subunit [Bacteroidota bacterium]